jgi:hypothetical protein
MQILSTNDLAALLSDGDIYIYTYIYRPRGVAFGSPGLLHPGTLPFSAHLTITFLGCVLYFGFNRPGSSKVTLGAQKSWKVTPNGSSKSLQSHSHRSGRTPQNIWYLWCGSHVGPLGRGRKSFMLLLMLLAPTFLDFWKLLSTLGSN